MRCFIFRCGAHIEHHDIALLGHFDQRIAVLRRQCARVAC
jgi:hypothetical protein